MTSRDQVTGHLDAAALLQPNLQQASLIELQQQITQHYLADEQSFMPELVKIVNHSAEAIERLKQSTADLVKAVRQQDDAVDSIDLLLQQYSLDTHEGVLLMCLAEALLRVPDSATADALIRDKLSVADWKQHLGKSDSLLVNASTWGLLMTGKLVNLDQRNQQPVPVLNKLVNRLGEPMIRKAMAPIKIYCPIWSDAY